MNNSPIYYYDWESRKNSVVWFDNGGLNAAYNAVDRHIEEGHGHNIALICENSDGRTTQYDFFQLHKRSNQIANFLTSLKVTKGDRVFIFLPRIPELYFSFIGILKTGAIAGTLVSSHREEELMEILRDSYANVVITSNALLPHLVSIKKELPGLRHVIVIDDEMTAADIHLQPEHFKIVHTTPEDDAFMLYTAEKSGKPKGIVHTHYSIIQQIASAQEVFEFKPHDIFWCTADPGWVTIVYSILANLALGVTTIVYGGRFDPEKWYHILEKYRVTVWCTSPYVIGKMMVKGTGLAKKYGLAYLRHLCSVGGILQPEEVLWGKEAFGKYFYDTWGQPETGSIMIGNTPDMEIKPGSIGKPLPWVEAAIHDDDGSEVPKNQEGNLVIKQPWPSLMRTIWQNNESYRSYFKEAWYRSCQKAKKESDGYFWLIQDADDVIKASKE